MCGDGASEGRGDVSILPVLENEKRGTAVLLDYCGWNWRIADCGTDLGLSPSWNMPALMHYLITISRTRSWECTIRIFA